jgi:serine/threonine protein kinase
MTQSRRKRGDHKGKRRDRSRRGRRARKARKSRPRASEHPLAFPDRRNRPDLRAAGVRGAIGEGTYGCVFDPPLTPFPLDGRDWTGFVSKVFMLQIAAEEEVRENARVSAIDPEFAWHLQSSDVLELDTYTDPGIYDMLAGECGMFSGRADELYAEQAPLYMIQYQSGGMSVDRVKPRVFRTAGAPAVIGGLRALCQGVQDMARAGACHLDIKTPNTVYDPASGRFRFIDFGLMAMYNEFSTERDGIIGMESNALFPLDFKCLIATFTNIDETHNTHRDAFARMVRYMHAVTQLAGSDAPLMKPVKKTARAIRDLAARSIDNKFHRSVERDYPRAYRGFLEKGADGVAPLDRTFVELVRAADIDVDEVARLLGVSRETLMDSWENADGSFKEWVLEVDAAEGVDWDDHPAALYVTDRMVSVMYDFWDVFSLGVMFAEIYNFLYRAPVTDEPVSADLQEGFRRFITRMCAPNMFERVRSSQLLEEFDRTLAPLLERNPSPTPAPAPMEVSVGKKRRAPSKLHERPPVPTAELGPDSNIRDLRAYASRKGLNVKSRTKAGLFRKIKNANSATRRRPTVPKSSSTRKRSAKRPAPANADGLSFHPRAGGRTGAAFPQRLEFDADGRSRHTFFDRDGDAI